MTKQKESRAKIIQEIAMKRGIEFARKAGKKYGFIL